MVKRSNRVETQQPTTYEDENVEYEWSSGLCDCCEDCKICCYAYWFFPCFTCYLFSKAGECCCTSILCPGSGVTLRTKIRTTYGIKGKIWKDYCAMIFCNWCNTVRMANELKAQGVQIC